MNLRLLSVSKMFIDECVGMSVKDLILMIFFSVKGDCACGYLS